MFSQPFLLLFKKLTVLLLKLLFNKRPLQTALFTKTAPEILTLKPMVHQYCLVDLIVIFATRQEK
jgi:hypothetical protein